MIIGSQSGFSSKRLCQTRWSAHHDAVKSISLPFDHYLDAIGELTDDKKKLGYKKENSGISSHCMQFLISMSRCFRRCR